MRFHQTLGLAIAVAAGLAGCGGDTPGDQRTAVSAGGSAGPDAAGTEGGASGAGSGGASGAGSGGAAGGSGGTAGSASVGGSTSAGGSNAAGQGGGGKDSEGACEYDCSATPIPLTEFECLCPPGACPETYADAIAMLAADCGTGFLQAREAHRCANTDVRVVIKGETYSATRWYFGAANELIGTVQGTDCNCGPCNAMSWGAGQIEPDCVAVDVCTPCPSNVDLSVPLCP
jgi:hypothetical protein